MSDLESPTGEQKQAEKILSALENAGFEALYAGGKLKKGHGFWIRGVENPRLTRFYRQVSAYHSIAECENLLATVEREAK